MSYSREFDLCSALSWCLLVSIKRTFYIYTLLKLWKRLNLSQRLLIPKCALQFFISWGGKREKYVVKISDRIRQTFFPGLKIFNFHCFFPYIQWELLSSLLFLCVQKTRQRFDVIASRSSLRGESTSKKCGEKAASRRDERIYRLWTMCSFSGGPGWVCVHQLGGKGGSRREWERVKNTLREVEKSIFLCNFPSSPLLVLRVWVCASLEQKKSFVLCCFSSFSFTLLFSSLFSAFWCRTAFCLLLFCLSFGHTQVCHTSACLCRKNYFTLKAFSESRLGMTMGIFPIFPRLFFFFSFLLFSLAIQIRLSTPKS